LLSDIPAASSSWSIQAALATASISPDGLSFLPLLPIFKFPRTAFAQHVFVVYKTTLLYPLPMVGRIILMNRFLFLPAHTPSSIIFSPSSDTARKLNSFGHGNLFRHGHVWKMGQSKYLPRMKQNRKMGKGIFWVMLWYSLDSTLSVMVNSLCQLV
jgi:hypothetical protein